jgi:hypothetical protein
MNSVKNQISRRDGLKLGLAGLTVSPWGALFYAGAATEEKMTIALKSAVGQPDIVEFFKATSAAKSFRIKPRCTTANARKVLRDIDEDVRDHVRALADTEALQRSRRERKKVEMRFAHMKRILKLDRLPQPAVRGDAG